MNILGRPIFIFLVSMSFFLFFYQLSVAAISFLAVYFPDEPFFSAHIKDAATPAEMFAKGCIPPKERGTAANIENNTPISASQKVETELNYSILYLILTLQIALRDTIWCIPNR